MKRLLFSLMISVIALPAAGQLTFNGYNVSNYELAGETLFKHYKRDIYLSRENTGNFDAILIYTEQKRFVFADQNGEDTTFKKTYAELTDRFGKEDKNEDSIPKYYESGNLSQLKRLVRSKRARIYRVWNRPEENITQILLIWDDGGLTLAFDGG